MVLEFKKSTKSLANALTLFSWIFFFLNFGVMIEICKTQVLWFVFFNYPTNSWHLNKWGKSFGSWFIFSFLINGVFSHQQLIKPSNILNYEKWEEKKKKIKINYQLNIWVIHCFFIFFSNNFYLILGERSLLCINKFNCSM